MTDEEYAALEDRARTILKMLKEFPSREFLREAEIRNPPSPEKENLGMRMWAAYLEACT